METRTGVFLCNCGGSLSNIDFDAVAGNVARTPAVTCVNLLTDLCRDEGRRRMIACISEERLDRVVVAGCSPLLKEHHLQQALEDAGLNPHMLAVANIREQCSWAHEGDVTAKATELTNMAVNQVRLLSPVDRQTVPVNSRVLVIGGGFSASESALRLSRVGLPVTLLPGEALPETAAGGPDDPDGPEIRSIIDAAQVHADIEVLTCARITAIKGTTGDFVVTMVRDGDEISARYGAIILAVGHRTEIAPALRSNLPPEDQLSAGGCIVSQEQLARMLRDPMLAIRPHTIGFVIDTFHAGSRVSTLATLNSALAARSKWDSETYVFCRDMEVDSDGAERLYRRARHCGVVFVKCDTAPGITMKSRRVVVQATDVLLGEEVVVACDILVADGTLVPTQESATLSSLLGIRTDPEGFCQYDNIHLYPVASEKKGVFVTGGCRGDLDFKRALDDVSSAVISTYELLSQGQVVVDRERVKADPQKCVACLTCIRVCPHGAIELTRVDGGKEVALISDLACDACGVCAAICPAKAIEFQDYRDDQLLAQIEVLGET